MYELLKLSASSIRLSARLPDRPQMSTDDIPRFCSESSSPAQRCPLLQMSIEVTTLIYPRPWPAEQRRRWKQRSRGLKRTGHVAADPALLVPSLSSSRPSMRLSFNLLCYQMIG